MDQAAWFTEVLLHCCSTVWLLWLRTPPTKGLQLGMFSGHRVLSGNVQVIVSRLGVSIASEGFPSPGTSGTELLTTYVHLKSVVTIGFVCSLQKKRK